MSMGSGNSPWLTKSHTTGWSAKLRQHLQQLGPIFIKFGQFLALSPDLVPQEYCNGLMLLLDEAPLFQWQEAREIFIQDLGVDPDKIFDFINHRPLSAESLAQVYAAKLKDGSDVLIKIQRPEIRTKILHDLDRPQIFEQVLKTYQVNLPIPMKMVIDEFTQYVLSELDYIDQVENANRMFRLSASSPFLKTPYPFPSLCSPRVMTMESLQGIPISNLLVDERFPRANAEQDTGELDYGHARLAANLISATFVQIFQYQFYQADLHPVNVLALPDGRIGFANFGFCKEVDSIVRKQQLRYLSAVFSSDTEEMFNVLTEVIADRETDINAFRVDFSAELGTEMGRRSNKHQAKPPPPFTNERSRIAHGIISALRITNRYGLHMRERDLGVYRTLLTAETVVRQLNTGTDLESVGREYLSITRVEEALSFLEVDTLQKFSLDLLGLWRDAPGQLHQILTQLSDGRFAINVYNSESLKANSDRNKRTQLLVSAILAVSIALLLSRTDWPVIFGMSAAWFPFAVLILLYIWIYIQWRRLR